MKSLKIISDWLIIFLFAAVLTGTLLLWIIQPDRKLSESEKRPLASFPTLVSVQDINRFTRDFDLYYQDHFGFREWMIHRYQREVSKRFGESGAPLAIEGKDGWLFYAMDDVLVDLQGELRFSEDNVKRLCSGLQAKKEWFARLGILYLPLIAPNKQSVYEHKLKDSYRALKGDSTRLDQVLTACGPLLYDLRPELKEQSIHERGYAKTDTHWNEKGALLGYYYLMQKVQTAYPDFSFREQFTFADKMRQSGGGDLAVLLGMGDLLTEEWPVLTANELPIHIGGVSPAIKQYLSLPQLQPLIYLGEPSARRLLVLHDSFFNILKSYVAVNFSQTLYVWQFYDDESLSMSGPQKLLPVVQIFQPAVVIEEIVERHIEMLLKSVDHDWSRAGQPVR